MIANTRKMYELQLKIGEMLERENITCDMFNACVSKGTFSWERME